MTETKRLLAIKARLKKRQPKFIRQDNHKKPRLKNNPKWRSPKGLHSKIGDHKQGHRKRLEEGYHTPLAVRGLDKHGLKPTLVFNLADIAALDPKVHSVIIGGGTGGKRKVELIEDALAKGFSLRNASKKTAEEISARFHKRREETKAKQTARQAKEEKAAKAPKKDIADTVAPAQEHAHDHAHEHAHDAEKPVEKKPAAKKAVKKAAKKEGDA